MESIINIEDRLRVIKAIFELSIEAKVFPEDIYIYTINQKWNTISNFKSESLSLIFEDPRHKKTIDIIYNLSNEIIVLYDRLVKYIGELGVKAEYKYKIDCIQWGKSRYSFFLVKSISTSHQFPDEFQFIDGKWWPYERIIYEENSDFTFTRPLFLIELVMQINQFLKDRILLEKTSLEEEQIHSLLKYVRDDTTKKANRDKIDNVLQKCKDNLNGTKFDLGSYAALYLVIFEKYNNLFKRSTSFSDVQKLFDEYFGKNTRNFKPGKVEERAEKLKHDHRWIDIL